jgi:hypothetical protein
MGVARLHDVPWSALAMLNIEHLRKQAKLFARWHRQLYYPVAARIGAKLPRCSRLIDREVLRQPFRLSGAQELVARTFGFECWEALCGSHLMTHNRAGTTAMPTLVTAEPQHPRHRCLVRFLFADAMIARTPPPLFFGSLATQARALLQLHASPGPDQSRDL